MRLEKEELILNKNGVKIHEYSIYVGEMYMGMIQYSELNQKLIKKLKKQYLDDFLDYFCDTFETLDEEASSVLNKISKEDKEYVYLQKIDIGYNRGNSIGKLALQEFEKLFKGKEIILYAYPIPPRFELGFDRKYMAEAIEKVNNFYIECGYKLEDKHLMTKKN